MLVKVWEARKHPHGHLMMAAMLRTHTAGKTVCRNFGTSMI